MGKIVSPTRPRKFSVTRRRTCVALFAGLLALWGGYAALRPGFSLPHTPARPARQTGSATSASSPFTPVVPPASSSEAEAQPADAPLAIAELAPSDFPAALDTLLATPPLDDAADPLLIALLKRWADLDLDAARHAWARLPENATRRAILPLLARRLPAEQTLAWIRTLPDESEQHLASGNLAVVIAPSDAARAFALANEATPDAPGDEFMIEVTGIVAAQRSPLAAAQLLVTQPRTSAREIMLANFTRDWSRTDPAAATEFACRHLEAADTRETVIKDLLARWEKHDPTALKRWLATPRDDRARREIAALLTPPR